MKALAAKYRSAAIILVAVLLVGCASLGGYLMKTFIDQDADGVADSRDSCPESVPDSVVDDAGCALFAGAIADLDFGPGDHRLTRNARTALDKLIADLNSRPDVVVELAGHTDNRGSAADNLELSKQRVMSVVRYLVAKGIEPARLKPYGYGENRPIVSNATPEGRIKNRRIEVSVIAQ